MNENHKNRITTKDIDLRVALVGAIEGLFDLVEESASEVARRKGQALDPFAVDRYSTLILKELTDFLHSAQPRHHQLTKIHATAWYDLDITIENEIVERGELKCE